MQKETAIEKPFNVCKYICQGPEPEKNCLLNVYLQSDSGPEARSGAILYKECPLRDKLKKRHHEIFKQASRLRTVPK